MSLGGALGFAAAYDPWGRSFRKRFGNPFGPFLNNAFRSPLLAPTAQRDLRLLPDSLAEALGYPLLWARRSEEAVLEPPLAGLRFAGGPNAEWAGAAADPASHAARALRAVRSHPGPAFVLLEHPDSYGAEAADTRGVGFDRAPCRPVANNLTRVVQLCRWR